MAVRNEKCKLTQIPIPLLKLGLGDFCAAYSSANAKETHPFFNFKTYTLILGLVCLITTLILARWYPLKSSVVAPFLTCTVFCVIMAPAFLLLIYVHYRDKNHYIKNIYIFSGGFVWEAYTRKGVLVSQRVFTYSGGACEITLKSVANYVYGVYKATSYKLIVKYFDFDKDKWRKFKLFASEKNKSNEFEKSTWIVASMKLIYYTWVNHKD